MGENQEHWTGKLRFHLATKGSAVGTGARHFSACLHVIHSIAEYIGIAVANKMKYLKHRGEQWT